METHTKTWLTRGQAAERAGVHVRTIARWLADGTLTRHHVKGRHRVLVNASEVDAAVRPVPERVAS